MAPEKATGRALLAAGLLMSLAALAGIALTGSGCRARAAGPLAGARGGLGRGVAAFAGGSRRLAGSSLLPPAFQAEAAANLSAWRSGLFAATMQLTKEAEKAARTPGAQPAGHRRFDLFSPVVTCPRGEPLTRLGDDGQSDGGKLVCASLLRPGCTVLSLGSNGNFQFEEAVLRDTPCQVVTYDCTYAGKSIGERHHYVQQCLGSQAAAMANPAKWTTLERISLELGLDQPASLLKIDIEGSEYDALGAPLASTTAEMLPLQISMELHYSNLFFGTPAFKAADDFTTSPLFWPMHQLTAADMALFVSHAANRGYAIVSREDNPQCGACSELTLLRVGPDTLQPPAAGATGAEQLYM